LGRFHPKLLKGTSKNHVVWTLKHTAIRTLCSDSEIGLEARAFFCAYGGETAILMDSDSF
jgi:hypothetical protein